MRTPPPLFNVRCFQRQLEDQWSGKVTKTPSCRMGNIFRLFLVLLLLLENAGAACHTSGCHNTTRSAVHAAMLFAQVEHVTELDCVALPHCITFYANPPPFFLMCRAEKLPKGLASMLLVPHIPILSLSLNCPLNMCKSSRWFGLVRTTFIQCPLKGHGSDMND